MNALGFGYAVLIPYSTSTAALAVIVTLFLEGSFATYLSSLVHKNSQGQQEELQLNE